MKAIKCSIAAIIIFTSLVFTQSGHNNKWIDPLNVGIEFAKVSYYGPVIQYNIYNRFQITCKAEYNPNLEKIFILPGMKYNFDWQYKGAIPYVGIHYSILDYIKYNKLYWNGMEVIGYWVMDVFVPTESTKQNKNINGLCLYGGLEYPVNNTILNIGIGTSHFPKIEEDHSKFLLTYKLGLYYSFKNTN